MTEIAIFSGNGRWRPALARATAFFVTNRFRQEPQAGRLFHKAREEKRKS
ncbi:hypothetical protein H6F71_01445 [Microcoleus sp. FACHB-61]|nr:hypothetical protein [Microcoleus sp. FACHB-61]